MTCLACVLSLVLCFHKAAGQAHGLNFASHEVVADFRTSLDLTGKEPICLAQDFELSFDLSFQPDCKDYFGYVFRLIGAGKKNMDLIYEFKPVGSVFKIISGDRVSAIQFQIDTGILFHRWTHIRLRFNLQQQRLELTTGGKTYVEKGIPFSGKACFRLVFGVNHDPDFKTPDVPPMKIRDVQLRTGGKPRFHWPLDEEVGSKASELVEGRHAAVDHPLWIRNEHSNWQKRAQFTVAGPASVAFNPATEEVYIVSNDSLYTYGVAGNALGRQAYLSGPLGLLPGNQSLYWGPGGRLFNIYVDQKLVTEYDFATRTWSRNYAPGPITDYWQYNKFYSPTDSSLYILGGYGHFRYKNKVQRYHFPSGQWSEVPVTGDRLTPRYLAALGAPAGSDTVWLLGGYGSASGEQIVNPHNLYDLVAFDVRRRTFKKLYDLKRAGEGITFGNTLIPDPAARAYYALAYPNDKYNSRIQLVRGSLTGPGLELLGKPLPYSFHDIHSFADLFYAAASRRFVTVTLHRTETATTVSLYTLASPPVVATEQESPGPSGNRSWLWWAAAALLLAVGAGYGWYRWRRKRRNGTGGRPVGPRDSDAGPAVPVPAFVRQAVPLEAGEAVPVLAPEKPAPADTPPVRTIFLFGDLQLFDREGEEITRYLTPLLKELFLLILLHTIRKGAGISSEKLNEMLWFDKDEKSARNNRSVNIAKLKNVLDRMDGVQIEKASGYWKADIDPAQVQVDYIAYRQIVKNRTALSKEKIQALARITRRGSFLANTEYAWLDSFKSEISNEIIDTYLQFAGTLPISEDPEFIILLANYIGYFDPVNEEAMRLKCKAYAHLGKHSLAKSTFENFSREYRLIYGEDFDRNLQEVLV